MPRLSDILLCGYGANLLVILVHGLWCGFSFAFPFDICEIWRRVGQVQGFAGVENGEKW